jgi:hypothetical protein
MQSKWWRAPFPVLYLAWAFYVLDVPDMPNPHAADIGFLGVWAFRSLNLIGGALFIAVVQVCWHAHIWFFSPDFQQLSTGGFVVLVALILLTGILQWLGVAMFLGRLRRAIRKPRPASLAR